MKDRDRIVFPAEVAELLGIKPDTVRKFIRSGRLPAYDVDLSVRYRGWRVSTLAAADIHVPPVATRTETPAMTPAPAMTEG